MDIIDSTETLAATTDIDINVHDPVPKSLAELSAFLHKELGDKGIDEMECVDVARVKRVMEAYVSNEKDWERFAHFDEGRYTRNLVDSGNEKFNLMVLCWAEDQSSAIHDHSNAHCLMKVLSGELYETQYRWPSKGKADELEASTASSASRMETIRESKYSRDQVAYICDDIGLHRVANKSISHKAVSLHLYCPPFETCQTFNERTGECRGSGRTIFHSVNGHRISAFARK